MYKRIFKYSFLFLLLAGCASSNLFIQKAEVPSNMIRVAVLRNADSVTVKLAGPYIIYNALDGKKLLEGPSQKTFVVSFTDDGCRCGEDLFQTARIKIVPQRSDALFIGDSIFRGDVTIVRTESNKVTVVNTLELEDYLKGVVPKEISDRWPLEAIKAQAIVARTYTLYIKKQKKYPFYDLTSDISSQVYGGQGAERYRTSLAVERTKGLVLFYNKTILPAYYHAACGGATEDAGELWGDSIPPLKGVICNFCKESPHAFWKQNVRSKDIQDKLNANGYDLGLIKEIAVVERNSSQRIKMLKITTRDGREVRISGKDFRHIVGPNFIKSNNYAIEMKGYYVDFLGKGWGHGIGLCQWGANFMARQGYSFDRILKFYYPGVEILSFYDRYRDNQ